MPPSPNSTRDDGTAPDRPHACAGQAAAGRPADCSGGSRLAIEGLDRLRAEDAVHRSTARRAVLPHGLPTMFHERHCGSVAAPPDSRSSRATNGSRRVTRSLLSFAVRPSHGRWHPSRLGNCSRRTHGCIRPSCGREQARDRRDGRGIQSARRREASDGYVGLAWWCAAAASRFVAEVPAEDRTARGHRFQSVTKPRNPARLRPAADYADRCLDGVAGCRGRTTRTASCFSGCRPRHLESSRGPQARRHSCRRHGGQRRRGR